jgi:hypothetical protein
VELIGYEDEGYMDRLHCGSRSEQDGEIHHRERRTRTLSDNSILIAASYVTGQESCSLFKPYSASSEFPLSVLLLLLVVLVRL